MGMTALTQGQVTAAALLVMLNGDPRPVIDRVAQSVVRGTAHDNGVRLAAALGHRQQRPTAF